VRRQKRNIIGSRVNWPAAEVSCRLKAWVVCTVCDRHPTETTASCHSCQCNVCRAPCTHAPAIISDHSRKYPTYSNETDSVTVA